MAEAVAAFGLAVNIIQVIGVSVKFVNLAYDIWRSKKKTIDELTVSQSVSRDLKAALQHLPIITSSHPDATVENETNKRILALSRECTEVAQQIIDSLDHLGISNGIERVIPKRKAFLNAFKLAWGGEKLTTLQTQLDGYRSQIMLELNISLRLYLTKSLHNQEIMLKQLLQSQGNNYQSGDGASSIASRHEGLGSALAEYLTNTIDTSGFDDLRETHRKELLKAVYASAGNPDSDASAFKVTEPRKLALQDKFILSLHYDGIYDRELGITQAHEETFRWIFDPEYNQDNPWDNFRHWLQTDQQLYWITGKAGAGKSTLMKFISQPISPRSGSHSSEGEPRCAEYLLWWAGGKPLIVASFYFWAAGSKMQTSREGFYRTLLRQICKSCPEAIPHASPERWEALCLYNEDPMPFCEEELRCMLHNAITFASSTNGVCLFIDGLDEFDGSHKDLIEFVKSIVETLPVKVCVASRPWIVFETAMKGKPSLMIEDLTFNDIRSYVTSRFESDSNFTSLQKREMEFPQDLIENVVRKASGVFLWVNIVVTSLLEGIKHADRVSDLQRRLSHLPSDLELLYDRILHDLDPFYLEHAAQYFRLMTVCEGPPEALLFSFADEEENEFAIQLPNSPLSSEEIEHRVETIRIRLNSRCKGLINVPGLSKQHPSADVQIHAVTVQYHHRAVRDYFERPTIQDKLVGMLKTPFDPYYKLCSGSLCMHKAIEDLSDSSLSILRSTSPLLQCLRFASKVEKENTQRMIKILDELESVTTNQHIRRYHVSPVRPYRDYERFGKTFISLAIKLQVTEYVKRKIQSYCLQESVNTECYYPPDTRKRSFRDRLQRLPLGNRSAGIPSNMWPLLRDATPSMSTDLTMLAILLENGADPNFTFGSREPMRPEGLSIWTATLAFVLDATHRKLDTNLDLWMNVLRMMMANGASKKEKFISMAMAEVCFQHANTVIVHTVAVGGPELFNEGFAVTSIQRTLRYIRNQRGQLEKGIRFDDKIWKEKWTPHTKYYIK
ncbi:hypothetical protein F4811DRAFT_514504 [Daldinia bambusicola]|nr:hypothetical protein F4811DRAFT_514504 [Daldinia bambusicola]